MQVSFSVNSFPFFLCLQLLCLISPFSNQCARACERAGVEVRKGGGGLLYQICHVICSIFRATSLFASFFHLPFPPLKSPTNWKNSLPTMPPPSSLPSVFHLINIKPAPLFYWKSQTVGGNLIGLALGLDGSVGNSRRGGGGGGGKRFDLFIHPHWNQWALSGVMTQPSMSSTTFLPRELHTPGAPPTIRGPSIKRTVVRNMESSC